MLTKWFLARPQNPKQSMVCVKILTLFSHRLELLSKKTAFYIWMLIIKQIEMSLPKHSKIMLKRLCIFPYLIQTNFAILKLSKLRKDLLKNWKRPVLSISLFALTVFSLTWLNFSTWLIEAEFICLAMGNIGVTLFMELILPRHVSSG